MNTTSALRGLLAATACATGLTACGGSGGTPADELVGGTDVPLAATQSAREATRFVRDKAASTSESADPLNLGDATLATSDTDEPEPV